MSDLYITVQGVKLRYRDTGGQGPALLLTHGIGSSLETWLPQEAALGQQYRVITWDLPGHGFSEFGQQPYGPDKFAHVAWALLDALQVENVTLSGNSLGAAISIRMQGIQPERVDSMVLLSSATLGRDIPVAFKLMLTPIIGKVITKPSPRGVDMQLQAIFHPTFQVPDAVRAIVHRNVFRPGAQEAFVHTLKAMTAFSGQHQEEIDRSLNILTRAQCPILFAHGRQDAVLPLQHSEQASRRISTGELYVFEDCGHTPQIEKPDEVCSLLQRFLGHAAAKPAVSERAVGAV